MSTPRTIPPGNRSELTLVTGASGFIGTHLIAELARRGQAMRALVREEGRATHLPRVVDIHVGDLSEPESLRGLLDGVAVVFHLGAAMSGDWETHRRATVLGTSEILRLAGAAGVRRFIHVSSIVVYDVRRLRAGVSITEACPLAEPRAEVGAYARGKIEAERLVTPEAAALGVTIVRPGLVYGPAQVLFEHLGLRKGRFFVAYGSGSLLLPLVHIDSVIDALVRIAETPGTIGRAYHVVDENDVTRRDYLRIWSRSAGNPAVPIGLPVAPVALAADLAGAVRRRTGLSFVPDMSGRKIRDRALSVRFDTQALRADTGWSPVRRLADALPELARPRPPVVGRDGVVRVGLIGGGSIAELHCRALRGVPGAEIVGLLDADDALAAAAAARLGIARSFGDAERFFAEARPQVVHVLVPPRAHLPVVLDALRRGAHVFCEKPLALSVPECEAIEAAVAESGLTLGVNHNHIHDPRVVRAREWIADGRLGEVAHVETMFAFDLRRLPQWNPDPGQRTHWSFDLPGGLAEDLLPHPLAVTLSFLQPAAQVSSARVLASGRAGAGVADEVRIALDDGRTTASVSVSLGIRPDVFTVAVYGSRATAQIEIQDMLIRLQRLRGLPRILARGAMVLEASASTLAQTALHGAAMALRRGSPPGDLLPMIRAHYAALAAGARPPATGADGRRVVAIIRRVFPL